MMHFKTAGRQAEESITELEYLKAASDAGLVAKGNFTVGDTFYRVEHDAVPEQPTWERVATALEAQGYAVEHDEEGYEQDEYSMLRVKLPGNHDERWFDVTVEKNYY